MSKVFTGLTTLFLVLVAFLLLIEFLANIGLLEPILAIILRAVGMI